VVCFVQVPYQKPVPIPSLLPHMCNIQILNLLTLITRISSPRSLQIMKILIMHWFPFSCYVPTYLPQHHISRRSELGLYVLVVMCVTNCCAYIKQRTELYVNSTVRSYSLVFSEALMFRFDAGVTCSCKVVEKLSIYIYIYIYIYI
jgi:hypothetical protein